MSKLSVHQRKARDFIQREDWANAVVELERMLGADAQNPTLHNQIGDVYLRKDEVGRACEHFEQAIDLYAVVGLHNNAVALCKKIQRLRPGRVSVRYRLAKLRLEQGFRSDAAASFREYLEHAAQCGESGEELEARCREIVDLMPDEAPIGLVLEKLEAQQRFVAAFEIVRTLAQRAADSGDDSAAKRYGEKMRSLRVLVERSGGRDLLADPPAPNRSDSAPAPASAALEPAGRTLFEPRILDLGPSRSAPSAEIGPKRLNDLPLSPPRAAELPIIAPRAAEPVAMASRPVDAAVAAPPLAAPAVIAPRLVELPTVDSAPAAVAGAAAETRDDLALPFIGGGFEAFEAPAPDLDSLLPVPAADDDAPVSLFDPLALGDSDVEVEEESDSGSHFAELAAALGGGGSRVDASVGRGGAATPAADWGALEASTLEDVTIEDSTIDDSTLEASTLEDMPFEAATLEDSTLEDMPLESDVPDMALGSAQPHASLASPQFAAPAATSAGWVDELRRTPVWIPNGDMLSGPDPTRPDRGLSMELESVIDSFREQMSRALDGDGQARYDLGVAYYDMGLYNEALAEFEAAAGSAGFEVRSYEMLAQCLLQTGRHAEVVEMLLPVVAADGHAFRGALGLHYCLGLAYEAIGDFDQARHCYEEVALVDVDFKDVQSRLQRT